MKLRILIAAVALLAVASLTPSCCTNSKTPPSVTICK